LLRSDGEKPRFRPTRKPPFSYQTVPTYPTRTGNGPSKAERQAAQAASLQNNHDSAKLYVSCSALTLRLIRPSFATSAYARKAHAVQRRFAIQAIRHGRSGQPQRPPLPYSAQRQRWFEASGVGQRSVMLIGYLGTGGDDNADDGAQRRALTEAGCEQVVEEDPGAEDSGGQLALCGLLARLHAGDVVVVPLLDSLGRSVADVVRCVQRPTAAGAGLRSLAEPLDAIAPQNGAAAAAVGGVAARDGHGAPERTGPGRRAVAGARRRAGGRPPKLSPEQRAAVADEVLSGRRTAADMARRYRVSEATISRLLTRHRAAASARAPHGQAGEDAAAADRIAGVLPLAALDDRLAIVGTSGSGKTYAAKGLAERLMAGGGRLCIVDPLGVWWGLRSAADGHAPSPYPVVVFGGPHADVALDPGMGTALGILVGTRALACVVDVSDFGSAIARRSFMTAFTAALYEANTEPLHLVLDEADLWAPQRAQPGGHELLGRVEEIVRRGRVRGFVPWLITQRPAVLHKDVRS